MIYLFLKNRDLSGSDDRKKEAAYAGRFEDERSLPVVTTQIPLYNEFNVAERIMRGVAAIDYPKQLHEIQVLDDSDDETCALVDRIAAQLIEEGFRVSVFRRKDRIGYKAGALEAGLAVCEGELIGIFDSDFIPPHDFYHRILPHFWADIKCGMVQARWDHLNQAESWLTRAQSLGVDGHFIIEQTARSRGGLFMNFCGTAGVWRRAAIEDSGGWQHDTVTEDLDLSYRAQLRGWGVYYIPSLLAPAELPATYTAYKSQQYRWAKGTMQTARKLLPALWRSPQSFRRKLQATVHLTHYTLHLQMAILALLILPLMLSFSTQIGLYRSMLFLTLLVPAAAGPSIGYFICQYYGRPEDWRRRVVRLPFLLILGFGISLSNARAVVDGLTSNDSTFIRTPKDGERIFKKYVLKRTKLPLFELLFAAYCALTVGILVYIEQYALIPFVVIYSLGFALVGYKSINEARAQAS
ncbi:MAG: glycosyltransferase [Puniceicoccaceae bacterium]|nr:MAG: glycosyltransferase [Puniceicoccaceae bacterium]